MRNALILLLAGVCQGSFGLGYKDYRPFAWALFWQVYNLLCLGVALVFVLWQAPSAFGVYAQNPGTCALMLLCGAVWGASAICFTKGIDLLGMALLYGISMGFSIIGGAVFPLAAQRTALTADSAAALAAGLALSALGILLITLGGLRREAETGENRGAKLQKRAPEVVEKGVYKGIVFAIFSGLGSALMNLGFSYGTGMNSAMEQAGISGAGLTAASWLLVIFGGTVVITVYCLPQIVRGRLTAGLARGPVVRRLAILAFTSVIWYAALCLYGVYTGLSGGHALVIDWVVFNALALIVSNLIGVFAGEWRGAERALRLAMAGNALMIVSWGFLGQV